MKAPGCRSALDFKLHPNRSEDKRLPALGPFIPWSPQMIEIVLSDPRRKGVRAVHKTVTVQESGSRHNKSHAAWCLLEAVDWVNANPSWLRWRVCRIHHRARNPIHRSVGKQERHVKRNPQIHAQEHGHENGGRKQPSPRRFSIEACKTGCEVGNQPDHQSK